MFPEQVQDLFLKLARDLDHVETLDLVAFLDVIIILERHAALGTGTHFGNFVLEALERLEVAFVDDRIVAQQAYACLLYTSPSPRDA